ncbi:MAG: sigma-54 interaction domain-containing protein [Polyangiales bacterium]
MKELHDEAMRVASADVSVLLTGETGVGKDVLARLMHKASSRGEQPMLAINCGAVTSSLIQSQLFGHERGAFTGAERRVSGIFEQADGGTVFLDEVGELPMEAQVSLLRVLETGTFTRVGSQQELRVDVRVLSATSRDLAAMCEDGSFRTDLLYRLNTVHFSIPPLRLRRQEIPVLAKHFLTVAQKKHKTSITGFSAEAMQALGRAAWPGNIRELRNVVERAAIMTRGAEIELSDIAGSLRDAPSASSAHSSPKAPLLDSDLKLKDQVRRYEAELILEALREANWNQTEAARRLEIPIRTLAHKIQKFDLKRHFPG